MELARGKAGLARRRPNLIPDPGPSPSPTTPSPKSVRTLALTRTHASAPRALIINRRGSSNRDHRSPRTSATADAEGHDEEGHDEDDHGEARRESGREEDLDLMYDPILNCYYDPKTNKYYELAP